MATSTHFFGNGVRQHELAGETTIRAAFHMKQMNSPAQEYHQEMKRELPVTRCIECGGAGYNIGVANGRCCKTSGEERCSGINAIATKTSDWNECTLCQATGYYRNKECPNCKGVGYLFAGLRDKATV
jgi:DnaJ-class molecular chaperone